MASIIIMSLCTLSGRYMVIFLAGLQAIPAELYEAARVDGASRWQQLFRITLPLSQSVTAINITTSLLGAFNVFEIPYIMTEGGPGHSSEVLALYMYRLGFLFFKFGEAAAVGFIIFVVILVISAILFKLLGTSSELR